LNGSVPRIKIVGGWRSSLDLKGNHSQTPLNQHPLNQHPLNQHPLQPTIKRQRFRARSTGATNRSYRNGKRAPDEPDSMTAARIKLTSPIVP
jgi:hypothetical protein